MLKLNAAAMQAAPEGKAQAFACIICENCGRPVATIFESSDQARKPVQPRASRYHVIL